MRAFHALAEHVAKFAIVLEAASLLGVHEMTIVNWETGKTKPRGRRLDLVKRFLRGRLPQERPTDSKQCKAG